MLQLLNIVLLWLFFGLLCGHLAKKRGRHSLAWFGIGLTIGIFGVATLFLLPKVEPRIAPTPSLKPFRKRSDAWLKLWYYLDSSHAQQGPLEFPDLIKKWKDKSISDSTLVWGEGMSEWKMLSDHPDLIQEFDQP